LVLLLAHFLLLSGSVLFLVKPGFWFSLFLLGLGCIPISSQNVRTAGVGYSWVLICDVHISLSQATAGYIQIIIHSNIVIPEQRYIYSMCQHQLNGMWNSTCMESATEILASPQGTYTQHSNTSQQTNVCFVCLFGV